MQKEAYFGSKNKQNKDSFDYKKIIYPACAMFFVLVFIFFAIAASAGINVFESETERVQIYDGDSDTNNVTSETKEPEALPIQTLFGLLLFSLSTMALGLLFKLKMNRIYLNLIHFLGTLFAFFIFVLAMTGNVSENGAAQAMVMCLAAAVIYFIVRGLIILLKKLFSSHQNSPVLVRSGRFFGAVFLGFVIIVFVMSLFALVTQFDVIVKVKEDKTFISDETLQNIYVTVVTPLAPTVQNYLRYLASSAVFVIAYALLFTKLNKVLKVLLNFAVITAGYLGIWIFGFDYFRLVSQNALPAIILYLAAYFVTLISVIIYRYFKKREAEKTADYQRQFK